MCYDMISRIIAPLLQEGNYADNFILPLHEAHGKKLTNILVLGTAYAQHGLEALTRARSSYDRYKVEKQLAMTKSWVSWIRAKRAEEPLLKEINLRRWSNVSHHFVNPIDASIFDTDDDEKDPTDLPEWLDLDEEVAKCFAEHPLEQTTAEAYGHDDYIHGFDCDCCLKTFNECALMYRCGTCDMDYCQCCVQRR